MATKTLDQNSARELIKSAVRGFGGDDKPLDPLLDSMFETARRQLEVAGVDYRTLAIGHVSVMPGGTDDRTPAASIGPSIARQSGDDHGGWPFPFSGWACIWYCPDGLQANVTADPPDDDDHTDNIPDGCMGICIEWWFP